MLSLVLSLVLAGNTGYCSGRGLARDVTPEECRESCGASGLDPLRNCCIDCKNVFHLACGGDTTGSTSYREKFNTCIDQAKQAKAQMQERQHQEDQQLQEAVRQRESDGELARTAASAAICRLEYYRAKNLAGIKKQREYSKIGGVLNLSRISRWQDEIRWMDEALANLRRWFKANHVKQVVCSSPIVKRLTECYSVGVDNDGLDLDWSDELPCLVPDLKPYMDTMRRTE